MIENVSKSGAPRRHQRVPGQKEDGTFERTGAEQVNSWFGDASGYDVRIVCLRFLRTTNRGSFWFQKVSVIPMPCGVIPKLKPTSGVVGFLIPSL